MNSVETPLKEVCDKLRRDIREQGTTLLILKCHTDFEKKENYVGQNSEMTANIMLAYRHLEDARMRVGKILQAADDGVSILDKLPSEIKENQDARRI